MQKLTLKLSFLLICIYTVNNSSFAALPTTNLGLTIPVATSGITTNPPVAAFSASPYFGTAPIIAYFNASASTDPDNDPLTYIWNFGDGTSGFGIMPAHLYNMQGSYLVTLTVSDGTFTDISSTTITVNANNPGNNVVTFSDATTLLNGSNFSGVAMAVADMNADGKDDIVRYNQGKELNIQYQNASGQTFTNYYFGAVSSKVQWGTCIADFDHDGYNDILSGGAYDQLKLISNNSLNYSSQILANSNIFLQGSNFADINNDGWADIFACHDDAESRAYTNNTNGTFTFDANLISTETVPTSDNSGNYASMWTDYDNDGDLDLYISKCRLGVTNPTDPRRINMLWQNDGNNNYTEMAAAANLKITHQSWVTDFGDIDNDGDLDCMVINHLVPSNLLLNDGNGVFTDITATSGLSQTLDGNEGLGIQAFFRDFNNDGFIDIIYTGAKHFIFYNNGDGTFTEAPNPFGTDQIESLAVGDLNHDGFVDIYAGYAHIYSTPSNISDRLFLNDGNSNHFMNVRLQGTLSNINGIGARIEIHGPWGIQIREVRSGEGYGIHNSMQRHFGLGQATAVDSIVVKWPSGTYQTIDNITGVDQFLVIVETPNTYNCIADYANGNFSNSYPPLGSAFGGTGIEGPFLTTSADFEVTGRIMSNQVIGNNATLPISVDYDAGESIDLLPGFEVKIGVLFDAFIDQQNCNQSGGNQ